MSVIKGTTRLAGVVGNPLDHSLSPAMHNAAYENLGLDWVYVPLQVADEIGLRRVARSHSLAAVRRLQRDDAVQAGGSRAVRRGRDCRLDGRRGEHRARVATASSSATTPTAGDCSSRSRKRPLLSVGGKDVVSARCGWRCRSGVRRAHPRARSQRDDCQPQSSERRAAPGAHGLPSRGCRGCGTLTSTRRAR